ncbi:hypothetical protein M422DRAFT_249566 [Sphaerobolus stellatus SS14]|uniref:Uncharacterized protein n=1 Tax=Sphaerobolus stellatus (strain SS14) TaxID=990650 RepID=A0A0C9VUX7_SPHS4|nr:hypothetical protein M422DRAFT_249566 [Sphaerobolus stellatus SS14]
MSMEVGYGVRREGICTLERVPWAQMDGSASFSNGVNDGIDNLQCKPWVVLDNSAILIHLLVAHYLQELIDGIAIPPMDLNAIEPRFDGVLHRLCIILNVLFGHQNSEGTLDYSVAGERLE